MSFYQVHDMDVVTLTSAVHRFIVIPKHIKVCPLSSGYLRYKRHQVVGYSIGQFANQPTFMGSYRIEVPEQSNVPTGIACSQILKNFFYLQLGSAVRIGSSSWMILIVG